MWGSEEGTDICITPLQENSQGFRGAYMGLGTYHLHSRAASGSQEV